MTSQTKKHLLLATTAAMSVLGATPAFANSEGAAEVKAAPTPVTTDTKVTTEVKGISPVGGKRVIRAFSLDTGVFEAMSSGAKGKGTIRPFGGPFSLHSGRYATFAGDIVGTSGRIRAMEEDGLAASSGRIRAMAGDIGAFSGRIRAMWGDPLISTPTVDGFWGNLYSQYGGLTAASGRIRAMDGDIAAFSGRIRAMSGRIRAMDGTLLSFQSNPTDYTGIHNEIANMVSTTKTSWGSLVAAQSGSTYEAAFANKMLDKYGIKIGDPSSIAGMNEIDLELFLLDWRDNLMLYSGVDSVDHWMPQVNWSPAITHQLSAGTGKPIQIGLIDFTVGGDAKANVLKQGGYTNVTGDHGTAVASLIVGSHDGRGVMGFAPKAQVIAYNPFDSSGTASWQDVTNGLKSLGETAYVINMSLGVPGFTFHPEWRNVLGNGDVKSKIQDGVFVIAAGNDGVTQTQNVNMKDAFDSTFIVVGSVGPTGEISGFSNRPGTVCLTDNGDCKNTARWTTSDTRFEKSDYLKESGLLMNRFIVAPGEFILVDDGEKGVTRMSGTSFATPLVSGAIALIAERWPWMMDKPLDVANVILSSAKDLGAPGTDPVYGRGMLDVEAALAPKWGSVVFKQVNSNGTTRSYTFGELQKTTATQRATWEANGAYFSIFEKLTSTERDFVIPMSTKLVGRTVGTTQEQMHAYLSDRLQQALGFAGTAPAAGAPTFGMNRISAPAGGFGDLSATVTVTPRTFRPGLRQGTSPFDTGMRFGTADGKVAMRFGTGLGGADVDGQAGFGLQSDYDVHNGGANPFLGLASGAGYVAADVALSERLTLSAGFSAQNERRDPSQLSVQERVAYGGLDEYRASANVMSLRYRANGWLNAVASYTVLNEGSALLGMQSLDSADLSYGSTTDAATFGANIAPGRGLTLSMSGTLGRTRESDMDRQSLGVAPGGLVSSAFQVAIAKDGLFDGQDRARITLAQPLHVESGSLASKQVRVVNRETGEQGVVVDSFDIGSGQRRLVAEAMYGRSVLDGQGEFRLFGRANVQGEAVNQSAVSAGASFRLTF
jgi:hypothetical protein